MQQEINCDLADVCCSKTLLTLDEKSCPSKILVMPVSSRLLKKQNVQQVSYTRHWQNVVQQ
jgi:hypothetical protein